MDTKHCRACDTTKPVSEFSKRAETKDGRMSNCKACRAHYRNANKERDALTVRAWKTKNKQREADNQRRWITTNRERTVALRAKRRAAKLNRTPAWLTNTDHEAIVAIYKDRDELTALTGIQFHVDHVLPLQGELVSGLHVPTNLAVIPYYENLSKSNQYDV